MLQVVWEVVQQKSFLLTFFHILTVKKLVKWCFRFYFPYILEQRRYLDPSSVHESSPLPNSSKAIVECRTKLTETRKSIGSLLLKQIFPLNSYQEKYFLIISQRCSNAVDFVMCVICMLIKVYYQLVWVTWQCDNISFYPNCSFEQFCLLCQTDVVVIIKLSSLHVCSPDRRTGQAGWLADQQASNEAELMWASVRVVSLPKKLTTN